MYHIPFKLPFKATPPERTRRSDDQRQHYYNTLCVIHRWENFIVQLVKVLQYQEGRSGCWCLSAISAVCIAYVNALMMYHVCADCVRRNTHVDRQVGKSIKTLGKKNVLIRQTFLGPMPSTEHINTFRPLCNLMIAIGVWRDFQPA